MWNLQNQILENIKEEVKKYLGPRPKTLKNYYKDYKKIFRRYISFSNLEELISDILSSNVVYCGDYHTLREAQMTNIKLLSAIIHQKPKIIIAMEAFLSNHQLYIDAYMKNEINEKEFLQKVDYKRTFGFDWNNFKPILDFAKEHKLRVVGLDKRAYDPKRNLQTRDIKSARVIIDNIKKYPEHLIWVIIGDLHLAPNHLPSKVKRLAKKNQLKVRDLIIYQNSETLYKKLLKRDLVNKINVIKVRKNAYCIMNTPPWLKYQTYIHWMEYGESLSKYFETTDEEALDFSDEMAEVIKEIAAFLQVKADDFLDFDIYSINDISFIKSFPKNSSTYRLYKKKIKQLHNFVIPKEKILYLSRLDINNMAELAATQIYYSLSKATDPLGKSVNEYYARIIINALAFFSSKLLNYNREYPSLEELIEEVNKSKKASHNQIKLISYILLHESIIIKNPSFSNLQKEIENIKTIATEDYKINYSISETIGKILGKRLYDTFQNDNSLIEKIKPFFFQKYDKDDFSYNSFIKLRKIAFSGD